MLVYWTTLENQDCPLLYRISKHSVMVWDRVRVTLTLTLKQHSFKQKDRSRGELSIKFVLYCITDTPIQLTVTA